MSGVGKVAEKCRVDIIIPVFNDSEGISNCLKALEGQYGEFSDFGVIVVDNGSVPPLSLESRYPFPVSLIACQAPGSYAARNAGVRHSKADVLVFLDADCEPSEGWLSNGVMALQNADGDVVVGGEVLFHLSSKPSATEAYQHITGFGQPENIAVKRFSVTANLFVWRSVFENVGYFNEALFSGGDWEWCWRAGESGYPVIFEKKSVVYTQPRKELGKAITQARRIAGGRYVMGLQHESRDRESAYVFPSRTLLEKLKVILESDRFGLFMKMKVLFVAVLLMLARGGEVLRLKLGGSKERR